jgi:endonuclease G, mitochondrial
MPARTKRKSKRKSNRRSLVLWVLVLVLGLFLWWIYRSDRLTAIFPVPTPQANTGAATSAPRTSPSGNRNLLLGNPSGAVHDPGQPKNYLIERPQYVLAYNRDRGIPSWVSWQLTQSDFGDAERKDNFVADTSLPEGWYQVTTDDYTGSGYDRGHMCPSADRTATQEDNDDTFIMTNIVPQAPDNNRVTWEHLESYSRDLVQQGHVLYIITGGEGDNGTIAKGKVAVPRYTWKIIVVMPKGTSDIARITADTPVIAVRVPNGLKDKIGDWEEYRVTVASIEEATGFQFFTNLPGDIQRALKSGVAPLP